MHYFSTFYQVKVRESIAREFSNSKGEVDDMMAGLHEARARIAEQAKKARLKKKALKKSIKIRH
jgi:hypothetical protein